MGSRKPQTPSVPTWILKRGRTVLHGVTDLVEADGVLTFTHAYRPQTWPAQGTTITACRFDPSLADRPGPTVINPRMLIEATEAAEQRTAERRAMTTVYEYATSPSHTVHLVRQDDPGLYLRTLCGRDPVPMTRGDETISGIAATCRRCRSLAGVPAEAVAQ